MPVLLKFHKNWADEFDVSGFIALEEQEWKEYKDKVTEIIGNNGFEYGFGTNQSLDFNSAEDYLGEFQEVKISDEEYSFLKKHFPDTMYYGWNGKDHTKQKKYASQGSVPFYSDDDLKDIKERIEERIASQKVYNQGLKDGFDGGLKNSKEYDYISGYEAGVRKKKYGC